MELCKFLVQVISRSHGENLWYNIKKILAPERNQYIFPRNFMVPEQKNLVCLE